MARAPGGPYVVPAVVRLIGSVHKAYQGPAAAWSVISPPKPPQGVSLRPPRPLFVTRTSGGRPFWSPESPAPESCGARPPNGQ